MRRKGRGREERGVEEEERGGEGRGRKERGVEGKKEGRKGERNERERKRRKWWERERRDWRSGKGKNILGKMHNTIKVIFCLLHCNP